MFLCRRRHDSYNERSLNEKIRNSGKMVQSISADISAQFEYFFNSSEKAMVEMNI